MNKTQRGGLFQHPARIWWLRGRLERKLPDSFLFHNYTGVQAEGYEHRLKDFRLKAEGRISEHFSLNTFSLST
jgi:hypothetical protein